MRPPLQRLEALREEPRGDDLRAIGTDWLEDQQSPQAHLVRLGLELARLQRSAPASTDPAYQTYRLHWQALDHQLREYRITNQAAWLGPFGALGGEWGYEGGVLTHVALSLDAFRENGAELLRLHPIGSLRLLNVTGKLDRLHPLEHLRDLRRLSFRAQKIGPEGTKELAQCPWLDRLLALDLYINQIDAAALRPLTLSPNLPRLQELVLAYNPLDDEGGEVLADAPCWPDLWKLDLSGAPLGRRGLLALARSPRRHALRSLAVYVRGLDPEQEETRELHARFGRHIG